MADGATIYLDATIAQDARLVTSVTAHEAAHVLQSQILVSSIPVLPIGGLEWYDADRKSRRLELQAECLAVAQVLSDSTTMWSDDELRAGPGKITHWGYQSSAFWTAQGHRRQIGECNTWIAANELVTYDDGAPPSEG